MTGPELTPRRFDLVARPSAEKGGSIIWTLPAIARRIGTSADFVRDNLVKAEGTPLRTQGGRFYVFEDELMAFMRSEAHLPG
ncbi:hypothetical protein [Antarcticirhabdus aurantiaca]|uniref:Uncharacterized protein n=1 Tax=Antarcticirhabdus aurantiaca TaxID=2606717 RepID=A0ACD4NW03_9HYPH|nr:hypothetical protein OXU80_12475 [Jeongeuplla avenae]